MMLSAFHPFTRSPLHPFIILQALQMHKLDPLEVCYCLAEEQSQRAVAVAAEGEIAAPELAQGRTGVVAPARASAGQVARRAVDLGELVDQPRLVVARAPAPQQPQLVVGVPAAAAQRPAEEQVVARDPVARRFR